MDEYVPDYWECMRSAFRSPKDSRIAYARTCGTTCEIGIGDGRDNLVLARIDRAQALNIIEKLAEYLRATEAVKP